MKLNMIVGKKQIVLASLILILGIAVYINWTFANEQGNIAANTSSQSGSSSNSGKNYGDAELVNASNPDDYFAQARLEKQKARDEAVSTIAKILGESSSNSSAVQQATDKALTAAATIETEGRIETLIKSKGYDDCLVYLNDKSAKVVVKSDTDGLDQSQAVQIMDIVVTESGIASENISITEVKG